MVDKIHRPVLVLNGSFEPLQIITARRAMILIAKGAAIVQEPSKHFLHTSTMRFPLPSVIRLLTYRHVPRYTRSVSRKSILLRDGYKCQYCMQAFLPGKLTLDHVIPRSRGGQSTWTNMVAACYFCNNRKGARTPEEAGMTLGHRPQPFSLHAKHKQAAQHEPAWERYLFC
jgi:5-methylcytosine-specific restriction endonuclease McrA